HPMSLAFSSLVLKPRIGARPSPEVGRRRLCSPGAKPPRAGFSRRSSSSSRMSCACRAQLAPDTHELSRTCPAPTAHVPRIDRSLEVEVKAGVGRALVEGPPARRDGGVYLLLGGSGGQAAPEGPSAVTSRWARDNLTTRLATREILEEG